MNKTWKLTVNREELEALIDYYLRSSQALVMDIERSARIHDLIKRLNKKDEVEVKTVNPDGSKPEPEQTQDKEGW